MIKIELIQDFIGLVIISLIVTYFINKAHKGKRYKIRDIAGLDAIEEAVGRATEMGRPIHFSPGVSGLTGNVAAQTFAGLEMLGYIASKAVKYGAKIIVTIRKISVFPIASEYLRNAYRAEGQLEAFDQDSVQYLTDTQFAYAAGVMGILHREKVAANVMIGSFYAEALMMAEAGYHAGAIQIAGTANITQIPFFIAACDYVLIGEEVYAAGAIVSNNHNKIGSIVGQDYVKLLLVIILIAGSILSMLGVIS